MGVSWVLLGLALGAAAIVLAMSIYILLYWSRPSDKWVELPSRILVVFSLFFLFMLPVMIPLDRANSSTFNATSPVGINPTIMSYIWVGLMLFAIFLATFLLPLCYFYISSRNAGETIGRSLLGGLWKAAVIIASTLLLSAFLWWLLEVRNTCPKQTTNALAAPERILKASTSSTMPIYIYFIVFACFLGSIIFVLFLSVGLFIYPVSYIIRFIKRPHSMNKDELLTFKQRYKQRSLNLLKEYDRIYELLIKEYSRDHVERMIKRNERSALFSRSSLRKEARNFEKLERDLEEMEREYTDTLAMNIKETANPLKYYLLLVLGIFFLIVSVLWYIQIIAAALPKPFYILDKAFAAMDSALPFPILSIIFYSSLAIYILFCFVNGVTILGLKFVFFMKIYPMERNNTPLVGFVFNSMMMCVGALPSLLFLIVMMSEYTNASGVYKLFKDTVANACKFDAWFLNMYWAIVALSPVAVALWVTYVFVQCKRCKIRKRTSEDDSKKSKKGTKESKGLMSVFGPKESGTGIPTKGAMVMNVAKNMIGLND
ncbi:hypothetical protein GL50803_0011170 [Giardia duodenalis]|uniref:Uncharacterized protein n=1 Tax=Giardia intestinalis (strain ATCC 50803 / WB clone C6) TaxID=184922 RepID=A8B830_GIAIC|nr:hypothetical protein GL50803_0011170 [Giardia intestinalis]KAE8305350.1 hypothetical protein GL50803_0011170 [Giardia intestinalis]|eukprot:XP_001708932.1 Hypothetical protein GL50803_11170 [Giardia lamblia ATCC 50803]